MPVSSPLNQKHRKGITWSEMCAQSWSRQLATLGRGLNSTQRRGDVSFVDETRHVHFHYITDDVIVHPLCPTHIGTDPLELLAGEEKKKERDYSQPLELLRSAQACVAGLRKVVFRACVFSSG